MNNKREFYITTFFDMFEKNGYSYAILHHINKIFSIENDIDFVSNCTKIELLSLVKDYCNIYNCYLVNFYTIDINIFRIDIGCFFEDKWSNIELDCCANGRGKDLLLLNADSLIKKSIEIIYHDYRFNKICDHDEYIYYIRKKAYKKVNILACQADRFEKHIDHLKSLSRGKTKSEIHSLYFKYVEYYRSKKYWLKKKYNKVNLLIRRLQEYPMITISFLGPDGAGKSTVINKLVKYNYFRNSFYFHLKPLKVKNSISNTVVDPHQYPPYSILKSYLKVTYFILQYNLGWLLNIFPLKIKSSLIIFDRYYDDLLIDHKRYRYGGSINIAKFVRSFIPQPDLYFILTTDPNVIYKRKQEVTYSELVRQVDAYNELVDNKQYFHIDVNKDTENIINDVLEIILKKMNARNEFLFK